MYDTAGQCHENILMQKVKTHFPKSESQVSHQNGDGA